jgi:hypothetical protein
MGAIGALIAIALISAAILTPGVLGLPTSTSSATTSSTSQSTVIGSTNSGTSQIQTSSGPFGTLAVLMTDPPTIPTGVTAVYINYSDVAVHLSNAGNQTGWTDLQSSGDINLLSVINSTQTIAATNVTSGVFNALRFNVTSSVVTFQGKNYTADLVYQEHTLFVPIVGGITVSDGNTSAAVIEMSPTVLLLGNTTNPTFAFIPSAKGYTLSAQSISPHPHKGDRDDDKGKISDQIKDVTHFEITSTSLSPNSLSVTVKNTGNSTIVFRFVALTATSTISGGWVPTSPMGSVSKISEFFVVASNGSLLGLNSKSHQEADHTMDVAGSSLTAGSSATFTYNGIITIGALELLQGQAPTQQVNSGQRYVITVLGGGAYAQTLLIASTSTTTSTHTVTSTVTATSTPTTTSTSTTTSPISSTTSSTSGTSTTTTFSTTTSTTTTTSSTTSTTTSSTTTSGTTTSSTTSSSTTTTSPSSTSTSSSTTTSPSSSSTSTSTATTPSTTSTSSTTTTTSTTTAA